mmetsp:Transcript_28673/g.43380  ORF Transcript_28673/g.43380 Transcript_28673/m.43380 type:complete len:257 (-) Transcript_28673:178-948(-)
MSACMSRDFSIFPSASKIWACTNLPCSSLSSAVRSTAATAFRRSGIGAVPLGFGPNLMELEAGLGSVSSRGAFSRPLKEGSSGPGILAKVIGSQSDRGPWTWLTSLRKDSATSHWCGGRTVSSHVATLALLMRWSLGGVLVPAGAGAGAGASTGPPDGAAAAGAGAVTATAAVTCPLLLGAGAGAKAGAGAGAAEVAESEAVRPLASSVRACAWPQLPSCLHVAGGRRRRPTTSPSRLSPSSCRRLIERPIVEDEL